MPTVKDILRDKVSLDIRSVDRVLLHGWVKNLQLPGGVVTFMREQRGGDIPAPVMRNHLTGALRAAVERFAAAHGLALVDVAKGASQEARAQVALAPFGGTRGVVLSGKAQEEALSFQGRRDDKGTQVWFTDRRESVRVTHSSFDVLDADFILAFLKVCTDLPFAVKVGCNGHAWAKPHLRQAGITCEAWDNGFAPWADPARFPGLCHQLTAAASPAFCDRWVDQLPWPLSPTEREAG
jgi:hypothetical protein